MRIRLSWLYRTRRFLSPNLLTSALAVGGVVLLPPMADAAQGPARQWSTTAAPAQTSPALAFTGVTVVDVADGRLLPKQTVVVVGNRVQAVGRDGKVRRPPGTLVVDGRGKYLIPGLWDMHIHVWGYPQLFYPLTIANGVTGVRQMSEPWPGGLDSMLKWRREIASGSRIGPRIVGTGGTLFTKYDFEISVGTPEEGRRVVDSLKAAGADFIKVHEDKMAPEVYFAIAARAREIGIPLYGHLPNTITEVQASDSGQRTVEHFNEVHCWWPTDGSWPPSTFPSPDSAGVKRCAEVVAAFIRNGTWFVPTLTTAYQTWDTMPKYYWPKWRPPEVNKGGLWGDGRRDPTLERTLEVVRLLYQLGMPMLAGTDAVVQAFPTIVPGFSLHDELAFMVNAGLTPLDALRAATLNPAKLFKATDTLGTVAPGKLADLVLLDANPLSNIHNTTKIRAVVANGRYFDRAALDELLAGQPAEK